MTAVVGYCFLYGFTQWLEDGRGLGAEAAGLLLLPLSATGVIVSAATGRRNEVRGKLLVGSTCQVISCGVLLIIGTSSPVWLLILAAMVIGIPQGLNSLANQNALYYQADSARIASSAGLLRTFWYLGAISAGAANGAFLAHSADTRGLHHLAQFMLVTAAALLVLTLVDRSLARTTRARAAATAPVSSGSR
jgi:sugar phosphate permease